MSVTVVAWIIIVSALYSIVAPFTVSNDLDFQEAMKQLPPVPKWVFIFNTVTSLIDVGIGVALLKRQNWARYAYVAVDLISVGTAFATLPAGMRWVLIFGLLLVGFFAFLLFRRPASAWFAGRAE